MTRTPERHCWDAMRSRCFNPNHKYYSDYGGRGISVCEDWTKSFENFLRDMGPRPSPSHSIDRINNDGNYEPGNCRWATKKEQVDNRRSNRMLSFEGQTQTLADWARIKGIGIKTLHHRILTGWPVDVALSQPVEKRRARPEWGEIKLTDKQHEHMLAVSAGERTAYPGLHMGVLNSLQAKGLLTSRHRAGSIFCPHTGVMWRTTEKGKIQSRGFAKSEPQRSASRPVEKR